ncbi:unnamed protein product [Moneuplotes crassus]|uniref:Uncharacterized protein n=1 Tax=Euplotes crassus TaxID=5936 RepID=A0AAD1XX05_EUPCR|nr:unnamed protein product [Moneuplotes crassus]
MPDSKSLNNIAHICNKARTCYYFQKGQPLSSLKHNRLHILPMKFLIQSKIFTTVNKSKILISASSRSLLQV